MNAFAWTGVGIGALLFTIYALIWVVGLLSNPFGRWLLAAWTFIAVVVWAALGAFYLIARAV